MRCAACVPPMLACALCPACGPYCPAAPTNPAAPTDSISPPTTLPPHTANCPPHTDYKYIMRDEAMVTGGELAKQYERAEDYEDDFM